jgi:hypothetical protein
MTPSSIVEVEEEAHPPSVSNRLAKVTATGGLPRQTSRVNRQQILSLLQYPFRPMPYL